MLFFAARPRRFPDAGQFRLFAGNPFIIVYIRECVTFPILAVMFWDSKSNVFYIINPPSFRHRLVRFFPTQNKTLPIRHFTGELETPFCYLTRGFVTLMIRDLFLNHFGICRLAAGLLTRFRVLSSPTNTTRRPLPLLPRSGYGRHCRSWRQRFCRPQSLRSWPCR